MAESRATRGQIINHYNNRLRTLNETYRVLSSLKLNFPECKTIAVLSIGCGEDPIEAESIEQFLKNQGLGINFVGIDVDKDAIAKCKQTHKLKNYFQFHCISGVNTNEIANVINGNPYHLIITRHPVFVPNSPYVSHFERIFATTVPYLLAPNGALVASIYGDEERYPFLKTMSHITDIQPVELKESTGFVAEFDPRPTFFQMKHIPCHADRFVYAYPNFKTNLALELEKKCPISIDQIIHLRETLKSQLEIIGNKSDRMKFILKTMISKTVELSKLTISNVEFINMLAAEIKKTTFNEAKNSWIQEPLDNVSFTLTKRALTNENLPIIDELFNEISAIPLRLFNLKPENLGKIFEQSLIMVAARPTLAELAKKKPTSDNESTRVLSGFF